MGPDAGTIRRRAAGNAPRRRRRLVDARSGRRQSQVGRRNPRSRAAAQAAARFRRLGGALDPGAARHGAAHGDARARGERPRRRRASPFAPPARRRSPDAGARARAGGARPIAPPLAKAALRRGRRLRRGRDRRPRRRRRARSRRAWRPSRPRRRSIPISRRQALGARSARRGRRADARGRGARFGAILLEGVTGSGKTEVYFEAVAAALRAGPSGARPAARNRADRAVPRPLRRALRRPPRRMAFGDHAAPARAAVARGGERARRASSSARARRCSCPSPISASSSSTRSTRAPTSRKTASIYHARDMAVVRGRFESAPVVLASATPSLETRVNAEQGRYGWLRLASRFGERALPDLAGDRSAGARARRAAAGCRRASSPESRPASPTANRRCCSSTGAAMRR